MSRTKKRFLSLLTIALCFVVASGTVNADLVVIEPDDYADRTPLNMISPHVELAIHDGILRPNFPEDFGIFPDPNVIPVTALTNQDILGGYFTSTGTKTFGHAGVNFTSLSRSIGLRFITPTNSLSIDVIGRETNRATVGVLESYDASGNLLDAVTSNQLFRQDVETLTLQWSGCNVEYARAFSHADHSPFGAFDNLQLNTVPEPNLTLIVPTVALLAFAARRRIKRHYDRKLRNQSGISPDKDQFAGCQYSGRAP